MSEAKSKKGMIVLGVAALAGLAAALMGGKAEAASEPSPPAPPTPPAPPPPAGGVAAPQGALEGRYVMQRENDASEPISNWMSAESAGKVTTAMIALFKTRAVTDIIAGKGEKDGNYKLWLKWQGAGAVAPTFLAGYTGTFKALGGK